MSQAIETIRPKVSEVTFTDVQGGFASTLPFPITLVLATGANFNFDFNSAPSVVVTNGGSIDAGGLGLQAFVATLVTVPDVGNLGTLELAAHAITSFVIPFVFSAYHLDCPQLVNVTFRSSITSDVTEFQCTGAKLSAASVNLILAKCVAADVTAAIDLSGGTSAAPTGQGITDKATLIGAGCTVATN